MASIYDPKPRFQTLLRPLVGRLAGAGVTANQVTLAAAVLSGLTGLGVCLYPDGFRHAIETLAAEGHFPAWE
jgi:CDP-diacylglycerol--glycerol-3-phosphate 3-phosphatidyltransferase